MNLENLEKYFRRTYNKIFYRCNNQIIDDISVRIIDIHRVNTFILS